MKAQPCSARVPATRRVVVAAALMFAACDECDGEPGECDDSCAVQTDHVGTYEVTFERPSGSTATQVVHTDSTGFIGICACKHIIDVTLLEGPPDCTQAVASPATVDHRPEVIRDVRIENVAEPDRGWIVFRVDSLVQDEAVFGLYPGDRYPDAFPDDAGVRAERDPQGNGRVYTIAFTATDDDGESCRGSVEVCVPIVAGGACTRDQASFDSTQRPDVDLGVVLDGAPDPVGVGEAATYTATVTNLGELPAQDAVLTIDYRDLFTVTGFTPACDHNATFDELECRIQDLAGGGTATFTLTGTPTVAGNYLATASVFGTFFNDPVADNDRAEATVHAVVAGGSDLSITHTDAPDPVRINQPMAYTIVVTNHGPAPATGVSVTDQVDMVEILDVTVSQGTFQNNGISVTANLGMLASGAAATITVEAAPFELGSITATASVSGAQSDPDATNNTASATTMVIPN